MPGIESAGRRLISFGLRVSTVRPIARLSAWSAFGAAICLRGDHWLSQAAAWPIYRRQLPAALFIHPPEAVERMWSRASQSGRDCRQPRSHWL